MSRLTILLAASLVLVPAAGLAQRTPTTSVVAPGDRAVVSYADLDLATAVGKRRLDRRLGGAIEDVCGSFANALDLADQDRVSVCRKAAWVSARSQLADRPASQQLALNSVR